MSPVDKLHQLLNEKSELQSKIRSSIFDGSIEVKTVSKEKYIYVRKREAGRYKSTYIDKYNDELYALALKQAQELRAAKRDLRRVEKQLAKLGYS